FDDRFMNKFSAIRLSLDAVLCLTFPGVFLPTDAQIKAHNLVTHAKALLAHTSGRIDLAGVTKLVERIRHSSPVSQSYAETQTVRANIPAAQQETRRNHRRAIGAGAKTDEPDCDKTVTAATALRYMLVRPTTLAHYRLELTRRKKC
ncbi:MAG TPA: hypothetical protein VLR92_02775, partial [Blastocatellia bacterium]|nr:hypothetical protein [Blastocatellia bacterium]